MTALTPEQLDAVVYASVGLSLLLIVLLVILAARFAGRDLLDLAARTEREDVNGCDLLRMARQMDACAADLRGGGEPITHDELRQWARTCRRVAGEHLDTLNALTIESLQAVRSQPVHLGEFIRPCALFAGGPIFGSAIDPDIVSTGQTAAPQREARHATP